MPWLRLFSRGVSSRERLAADLKLRYSSFVDLTEVGYLNRFCLFQAAEHRQVSNGLHGRIADATIQIFDYQYQTNGRKADCGQTVIAFAARGLDLPDFCLQTSDGSRQNRRKSPLCDALSATIQQAYQTCHSDESATLSGERAALINLFFQQAELEQLVESCGPMIAEGGRFAVMCYRPGEIVAASDLKRFIKQSASVFSRLRKRSQQLQQQMQESRAAKKQSDQTPAADRVGEERNGASPATVPAEPAALVAN